MNKPVVLRHPDGSVSYATCCREVVPAPHHLFRAPARRTASTSRRSRLSLFAAAFALATAMFWATMLTAPPVSEAALSPQPAQARCIETGRRLGPWFEAQVHRPASLQAGGPNLNLMLVWYRAAQSQCASGKTERAAENFRAIETMMLALVDRYETAED